MVWTGKDCGLSFIIHFFLHTSPLIMYILVALILMLESAGVPITNNTLLLFTGALASLGHVNIGILMLTALGGSVAGAILAYLIGVYGGHAIITRLSLLFRIEELKILIVERWFQKSGMWMIFLSRMTPYVRPFACFPAGMARMPFARFLLAATTGSAIWCVIVPLIGWTLGNRWRLALHVFQYYPLPSLCAILCILFCYGFMIYQIKRSLARFSENEHVNRSTVSVAQTEEDAEQLISPVSQIQ